MQRPERLLAAAQSLRLVKKRSGITETAKTLEHKVVAHAHDGVVLVSIQDGLHVRVIIGDEQRNVANVLPAGSIVQVEQVAVDADLPKRMRTETIDRLDASARHEVRE